MRTLKLFIILFFLPLFIFSQGKKRLALVIGNSNYEHTAKLENPINDAKLIADALRSVNFEVVEKRNLTRNELLEQIYSFATKLLDTTYEAGFFYYAGHGIQYENSNYLVPVDAVVENDMQIEDNCVNVYKLMRYFENNNNKVLIAVLDACRNNPFSKTRSFGSGGLAKINAVSGSLIAYSTEPGKVAVDGKGKLNSPYSEALSKFIRLPNLGLEDVFKGVRTEVEVETNYSQSPREESALKGATFYFKKENDNSKVDVKIIEKEYANYYSLGNYKEALKKCIVLEGVYEHNGDVNISLALIEKKIEKAHLNDLIYQDLPSEIQRKKWKFYYENNANYLAEAIDLLRKRGIESTKEKELYSKAMINLINFSSFLTEWNLLYRHDSLIVKVNELISFNEKHFGSSDFKTASAYFFKGYLLKDSLPIESYLILDKAYAIFQRNNFKEVSQQLENSTAYCWFGNVQYYTMKRHIKQLNFLINKFDSQSSTAKSELEGYNELFYSNPQKLFTRINDEIAENYQVLNTTYKAGLKDYLNECTLFYHNYPLLYSNDKYSSIQQNCRENALKFYDYELGLGRDYFDSISIYLGKSKILVSSIQEQVGSDNNDENVLKEAQNNLEMAIQLSQTNLAYQNEVRLLNYYFYVVLSYNKKVKSCFTKNDFIRLYKNFSTVYPQLIYDFKRLNNQERYYEEFNSFFVTLRDCISELDSIPIEIKTQEANQYIEYLTNKNNFVYGSPVYLTALQHKAFVLSKSENKTTLSEVQDEYLRLIKLNYQHEKSWTLDERNDFNYSFGNTKDCATRLLTDLFQNYALNLIYKSKNNNFNQKDSVLLTQFEKFIEERMSSLLDAHRYYEASAILFETLILFYENTDKTQQLIYCNKAISIIENRLNMQDIDAKGDYLSDYYAKWYYSFFYSKKLDLTLDFNLYDKIANEYLLTVKDFKEYDIPNTTLDIYNSWIDYYFFRVKDFYKAKKKCAEAYRVGLTLLKSKEFNSYNNIQKVRFYNKLNSVLSRNAENALSPTNQDRQLCIDQCKVLLNFINLNYDIKAIKDNSNDIQYYLNRTFYTIQDLSYFNGNYDTALRYNNKQLELINLYSDSVFAKKQKITVLDHIAHTYLKMKDTIHATEYNISSVNNIDFLDTAISKNYKAEYVTKNFNSCSVRFVHFSILTNKNTWPCLEFDVNENNLIDESFDLRYFVDTTNELFVEKIKTLNYKIGGYKNAGKDQFGIATDTCKNIYFDRSESFKSSAYLTKTTKCLSSQNSFGKLPSGTWIDEWSFYIPLEEISQNNSTVSFVISNISKEISKNTLSRAFVKYTIPVQSLYTGFKNKIKLVTN